MLLHAGRNTRLKIVLFACCCSRLGSISEYFVSAHTYDAAWQILKKRDYRVRWGYSGNRPLAPKNPVSLKKQMADYLRENERMFLPRGCIDRLIPSCYVLFAFCRPLSLVYSSMPLSSSIYLNPYRS